MHQDIEASIKEIVKLHPEIVAAYLYGSYAKGTQTKVSDVDIALLLDEPFTKNALYPFTIAGEIDKLIKKTSDVRILNGASPVYLNQVFKYCLLYTSPSPRD